MSNSLECNSTARSLLIHAVKKQIKLREQDEWKKELPERCPPILWFGNAETKKPIILTVAANPSRKEYLNETPESALKKVKNNEPLNYRETPNNRFRVLNQTEELADILNDQQLQDEIINGYNFYFYPQDERYTAYTKWFGMNKPDSYNVEGFLRGFGASYYPNNNLSYQAVHIDLFPFATLSNFKCLLENENINEEDLFGNNWAANFIQSLITMLQPSSLILFGRTNFNYFSQYIDSSISQTIWQGYGCASYCIGGAIKVELPFIGLSTNLGNPKCFTAASLNQYGQHIQQEVLRSHPNHTQ
ncbi:hypothetical protein [Pleurocapsa sp. FMAR1]|uniref:hypothetical protein n=1 Tax=Pleurocapsa sp. FMAR1 TaxID=3040204 RepID=UPI0029C7B3D5|nr:hypothetical protein [Pleurocapsa sp. FMAR1]